MNILRKLAHYILGYPLVVLEDFDGELTLRLCRYDIFGRRYAKRFGWRTVTLLDDGWVDESGDGVFYVSRWREWPVVGAEAAVPVGKAAQMNALERMYNSDTTNTIERNRKGHTL